jgi:hypothetical protein
MVMLHDHHASARTGWGSDQNAWVSFGKQGWVSSRERRRLPLNTLADVLRSAFT